MNVSRGQFIRTFPDNEPTLTLSGQGESFIIQLSLKADDFTFHGLTSSSLLLLSFYLALCLIWGQRSPLNRATYKIVTMCPFVNHNRHRSLHSYQSTLYLSRYCLSSMHYNTMNFGCNPKYSFTLYIGPRYKAGFARSQDSQWLEAQFPLANLVTAFASRSLIVGTSSCSPAL